MLASKPRRMLLALSAVTAMARISLADCNCSVPPSPAVSTGVASAIPWAGDAGYGSVPYSASPGGVSGSAWGSSAYHAPDYDTAGPHWAPGGYEARVGSPAYFHDPAGGQFVMSGNPYSDHFGPGFQRHSLHGHYRFPYYNYRAPWYFPGKAVYNRNTNFAW